MIYEVIQTITDGLNIFLKTRLRTNEDKAVISALINQDGSVAMLEENKVLITLVNIEREPTPVGPKKDGKQRVHINFFVLFSCYFSNANYSEALKFLAFTMNYLNDNSSMDITEGGGLKSTSSSGGIKVQIEIESLTVDQHSNLWSTLGAKYMPSAFYKIRMIPLDSNSLTEFRPSAAAVTGNTKQAGGGGVNTEGLADAVKENSNISDTDSNQSSSSTDSSSQTSPSDETATQPPPSDAKTDPEKTKGKRPVFLSGMLGVDDNDDQDEDKDEQAEETNAADQYNRPQTFDADNLKGDAGDDLPVEQYNGNTEPTNQNPEIPVMPNDRGEDTTDKEDDKSFLGNKSKNPGSLFSPFLGPKKPPISNVNPPENLTNKGTDAGSREDLNKNLNSDSGQKS